MTRLISRAELARRAGVSKPAITKACKGALAAACERDRVDVDHPAVVAYLKAKQPSELAAKGPLGGSENAAAAPKADAAPTAPTKPARRRVAKATAPAGEGQEAPARPDRAPTEPEDVADEELDEEAVPGLHAFDGSAEELARILRALRPIVHRHGTRRQFKDWLDALNKLEEIRKRRLDNEETEGRLISRDLVKTHVFGAIDGANRRLLSDFPKTISRLLYASANAKESIEVAEAKVRNAVTQILKPVEATAKRVVEDA